VAPDETIRRFGPLARRLGVTRLANVTGLDYLGIPVFMAVRPMALSLSVHQGKGLDEAAAEASALMEAAELAHAEAVARSTRWSSHRELARRERVADPRLLPRPRRGRFHPDRAIPWLSGDDLGEGGRTWVPAEIVGMDYTLPKAPGLGCFLDGSTGLASGNHRLEAIVAGACEVIERDAVGLWFLRSASERARTRLRQETIADPDAKALLRRLGDRGMSVAIWDATSDVAVPVFLCRLREAPGNGRSRLGAFWGAGCHTARAIALIRAVTEAAQSRLTYIAGARDDLSKRRYGDPPGQELVDLARDLWERQAGGRRWSDVPSIATATLEGDVAALLARLADAGLRSVIAVDLSRPSVGLPVVRVVVPGLEGPHDHPRYRPSRRARAAAGAGQ
jgi:ribosomal protein S12 methylthiotransferase accessory factor